MLVESDLLNQPYSSVMNRFGEKKQSQINNGLIGGTLTMIGDRLLMATQRTALQRVILEENSILKH